MTIAAICNNYKHFVCNLENDINLLFAKIILDLKEDFALILEISLPYKGILNNKNDEFRDVISKINIVGVRQPFFDRNCLINSYYFMIGISDRIFWIEDEENPDSLFDIIKYSSRFNKDMRYIKLR